MSPLDSRSTPDSHCERSIATTPKKRKPAGDDAASPTKRSKPTNAGQLPPPGFTGTVLPANHPTVIYEILERAIEEATPEHRKIVAERYGIEVKYLHYAWRTIKWVSEVLCLGRGADMS